MKQNSRRHWLGGWWLLAALVLTTVVYWPGLSGGYLFDDYPNIVDNHGVQPHDASVPTLVRAALSSPSSEFKRPLASLSFAVNYLTTGLDPYWMKLTNLVIHLLNGLLVFVLARALVLSAPAPGKRGSIVAPAPLLAAAPPVGATSVAMLPAAPPIASALTGDIATEVAPTTAGSPCKATAGSLRGTAWQQKHAGVVAALIAAGWMLLPINLTGVLYVVQRMESMANLFVLLGLIGYVAGRRRMLHVDSALGDDVAQPRHSSNLRGFMLCVFSITVPTAVGILAKETAVMLPLYALLIEWALFRFKSPRRRDVSDESALGAKLSFESDSNRDDSSSGSRASRLKSLPPTAKSAQLDRRIVALFLLVLVLPMVLGLAWLLPGILTPETWATRDFTLRTRLLSEARIVADYVRWTLLPTPDALSFYHDDFRVSTGLLAPWTTLASMLFLAGLIALMLWLRSRLPLAALGIALFLGCQLLTGTILPLELVYEHRNYFASFGLLLALVPLLAAPPCRPSTQAHVGAASAANEADCTNKSIAAEAAPTRICFQPGALPLALPRFALLAGLMLCWATLTGLTAYAWGNPLRLAEDLAARAPQSPRAEYELGRTYIVYSHYDPASPFTKLAYAPLEKAAALPDASILPEQALIFMNARMHLPIKDAWWNSLIGKLKARKSTVQDESSLGALTQCVRDHQCKLPKQRMMEAYYAALSHPDPSARLLAMYGDYAWSVLDDHALGLRMTEDAVKASPAEPAYQITLIRMLAALGRKVDADKAIGQLATLNFGGRLNSSLAELRKLPGLQ